VNVLKLNTFNSEIAFLKFVFSLIVVAEQKFLLLIFSSAAPQRTAYSKVLSQMAAHLRTSSPM
jgi:hypothetical protein